MKLLIALAMFMGSPANAPVPHANPHAANLIPTVNLSAIRELYCVGGKGEWTGSGSIIARDVILTDLHVGQADYCRDTATGKKFVMYAKDPDHDMALLVGKTPDIPYIKYSCQPFKRGRQYYAYGFSDYMSEHVLFRQNSMIGTAEYDSFEYSDGGQTVDISVLHGLSVPGMSGGPIVDEDGYAHGNVVANTSDKQGYPVDTSYSYEYKDTILCK